MKNNKQLHGVKQTIKIKNSLLEMVEAYHSEHGLYPTNSQFAEYVNVYIGEALTANPKSSNNTITDSDLSVFARQLHENAVQILSDLVESVNFVYTTVLSEITTTGTINEGIGTAAGQALGDWYAQTLGGNWGEWPGRFAGAALGGLVGAGSELGYEKFFQNKNSETLKRSAGLKTGSKYIPQAWKPQPGLRSAAGGLVGSMIGSALGAEFGGNNPFTRTAGGIAGHYIGKAATNVIPSVFKDISDFGTAKEKWQKAIAAKQKEAASKSAEAVSKTAQAAAEKSTLAQSTAASEKLAAERAADASRALKGKWVLKLEPETPSALPSSVARTGTKSITELEAEAASAAASTLEKQAAKLGTEAAEKFGAKGAAKLGAKALGKALPLVGLGIGGYYAYKAAQKGDYLGAGINAVSGLASLVPGGAAVSIPLDVWQTARENTQISDEEAKKRYEELKKQNQVTPVQLPPQSIPEHITLEDIYYIIQEETEAEKEKEKRQAELDKITTPVFNTPLNISSQQVGIIPGKLQAKITKGVRTGNQFFAQTRLTQSNS